MFRKQRAIQIVARMPDDRDEALAILAEVQSLYENYLNPAADESEAHHLVEFDQLTAPIAEQPRGLRLIKRH